jgi:hypothetical protein
MRIWSLHPKYLDTKGLVALWREGLLAKHVLEGKTKGYKNHPQLHRFKMADHPVETINQYLAAVYKEAHRRGYHFDGDKISWDYRPVILVVTSGQLNYEAAHLLAKLQVRDALLYQQLMGETQWEVHPLFNLEAGEIAAWEILKK